MPRLTTSQWEQARAEYEVRTDRTLTDVAAQFGVDRSSMSLRAKREGWQRGKLHGLVLKKV
ncbi:MAG: hypothetical protein LBR82_01050, partial [Desulfovibrio sp.]|nr:hypothetical protein [Desulfovibrio sp.]